MSLETDKRAPSHPIRCDLCGGGNVAKVACLNGKSITSCKTCGLVFYDPMPTDQDLVEMYESETYFDSDYFNSNDAEMDTNHYRQFQRLANFAKGRVLEVGPGKGAFLKLCLERGLAVEGLEFSSSAAMCLQSYLTCPIHVGALESLNQTYDVVASFDVIEHTRSPRDFLQSLGRVLNPQGLLILSTVNIDNFLNRVGLFFNSLGLRGPLARLYPTFHLNYFTPKTLQLYLEQTGYEVLEMQHENYDPRKATSNRWAQWALRLIYGVHNLIGNKTNLYVLARKTN